jgi:hypothetical protein
MKMNFLPHREHIVLPLEILVVERFMNFFYCPRLTKVCMCVGNDAKVQVLYLAIKAVATRP